MFKKKLEDKVVLIAEDDLHILNIMAHTLKKGKINIITATNGKEALEIFKKHKVDLLLTDIMMPKMTGIELLKEIKSINSLFPVIVISAYENYKKSIELLNYGFTTFIKKPFKITELKKVVKKYLNIDYNFEESEYDIDTSLFLKKLHKRFIISSDHNLANEIVHDIIFELKSKKLFSSFDLSAILTAINEMVINAIEHGNLELSSSLKDNGSEAFYKLLDERKNDPKYYNRKVKIDFKITDNEFILEVEDEGNGFDHKSMNIAPDLTEVFSNHGRGLILIKCLMDEMEFNEKGNKLKVVKYKKDFIEDDDEE